MIVKRKRLKRFINKRINKYIVKEAEYWSTMSPTGECHWYAITPTELYKMLFADTDITLETFTDLIRDNIYLPCL